MSFSEKDTAASPAHEKDASLADVSVQHTATGRSSPSAKHSDSESLPPPPEPEEYTIPDGGLKACLAVFGGFLVQFTTFGYASSFGVYQDYYVLQGGFSSSDASWIGSMHLFLLFCMGLPAGLLFDKGLFHYVHTFGTILYVFSMFMLSLANPSHYYELILAQGVGMGLGSGFLLVPAVTIQAQHWKRHRAFAMGFVLAGSASGGIVYPILLNRLFNHPHVGFPWAVRASAFLTLGLLVIAGLCMTTRMPPKKPAAEQETLAQRWRKVARDWVFFITLLGDFLILWGLFFPYFYLQLWSNLHGLDSTFAFYSIAILNAGSVVGRLVPNALADRFGVFNVICPSNVIAGAVLFAFFGATSVGAVVVFALIYGFFSGAFASMITPTLAALTKDPGDMGFRLGLGYFVMSFAILTGSPIDGALLGGERDWAKPIAFSGVVMLAGSATMLVARHFLAKERGTQWV
ncbi:MFS general substrate transporter [Wolfiporia cocos MD-104 SS10]|uniref:MFS general substrate transporter n=1 Tax=Wolfiporia cocos (strain MD-104) TaxID=742152 RepID=A0A2H3J9V0_WOLCO|nr:MFS general substrate transporter [Wolfiporia cocos MD-104 SS10]